MNDCLRLYRQYVKRKPQFLTLEESKLIVDDYIFYTKRKFGKLYSRKHSNYLLSHPFVRKIPEKSSTLFGHVIPGKRKVRSSIVVVSTFGNDKGRVYAVSDKPYLHLFAGHVFDRFNERTQLSETDRQKQIYEFLRGLQKSMLTADRDPVLFAKNSCYTVHRDGVVVGDYLHHREEDFDGTIIFHKTFLDHGTMSESQFETVYNLWKKNKEYAEHGIGASGHPWTPFSKKKNWEDWVQAVEIETDPVEF